MEHLCVMELNQYHCEENIIQQHTKDTPGHKGWEMWKMMVSRVETGAYGIRNVKTSGGYKHIFYKYSCNSFKFSGLYIYV